MTTNSLSQVLSKSGQGSRGVARIVQATRSGMHHRRWGIGILLSLTSLGMTACASTASVYNPDHLRDDQAGTIANICQGTLGLNPKESPVLGVYMGSPHLDAQVSHYQACIASLSDSVQRVTDAATAGQADQECRARGFGSGSPALAECVLDRLHDERNSISASTSPAGAITAADSLQHPVGSFFYASAGETRRREELACAQLGLEPPNGHFADCVKLLNDNFYAIDNPIT